MTEQRAPRDWNGLLAALAFIALGAWVLYESRTYTEFGAVFPRAVSMVMILAAVVWILLVVVGIGRSERVERGSLLRPVSLMVVGAAWALLIPELGFVGGSLIGFVGAMVVAKFHSWSLLSWLGHVAVAVIVTAAAYVLFAWGLSVPL